MTVQKADVDAFGDVLCALCERRRGSYVYLGKTHDVALCVSRASDPTSGACLDTYLKALEIQKEAYPDD